MVHGKIRISTHVERPDFKQVATGWKYPTSRKNQDENSRHHILPDLIQTIIAFSATYQLRLPTQFSEFTRSIWKRNSRCVYDFSAAKRLQLSVACKPQVGCANTLTGPGQVRYRGIRRSKAPPRPTCDGTPSAPI